MQSAESSPDVERQERATHYAKLTRWLFLAELVTVGTLLLFLAFGGISVKISHFLAFHQPWASAAYFIILVLGIGVILMPLSYYQGFVLPRRYGLSSQTFGAWIADSIKAAALGILLSLVIIIVIYWLMDNLPAIWWLFAAVLLLLFSLLLTKLAPTLFISLFFKLEPLDDTDLRQRLMNLAERTQTKINDVFIIDLSSKGTTANAMLAGLGNTRHIILSDTLLQEYSPEEIEVILAHELGHHLHRDIPKLIAIQAMMALLFFYLTDIILTASVIPLAFHGITDVAALPLFILSLAVFGLILMPLVNVYSRHLEIAADKTALELTANPSAFIAAMTKLTDQNLAESQPSRWVEILFHDHPPYYKRIALANRCNQPISNGGATLN